MIGKDFRVAWEPQPGPQTFVVTCPVHEVLMGGARGGGKSQAMLGDFGLHAAQYGKDAKGVFFRREYNQLEDIVRDARNIYEPMGATWLKGAAILTFPNGATLRFRHLWDETAAARYQGQSLTWLCFEELTNWPTPEPIDRLRATLRSAAGVPTFLRATANPGGPGHGWVRARYISPAPGGYTLLRDPETGLNRVFVPSRLEHNKILTEKDPHYERRLMRSGNAALVKAWRWGDWNIVAGGFFDEVFSGETHVLAPFPIPPSWKLRRSFDWGFSKPASLGLWAISDGTAPSPHRTFARGTMIRIGEWYGCEVDEARLPRPNVGVRLNNQDLGIVIAERSGTLPWRGCVADPSIFVGAGTASIYEQLRAGAKIVGHGLTFAPANNDRRAGWARMRTLLENALDEGVPEDPGLFVFETCADWLRTVPVLQRARSDPDDVDTTAEDHAADETRYLVMSEGIAGGRSRSRGFNL